MEGLEFRLESFAGILNYMEEHKCGRLDLSALDPAELCRDVRDGYPLHVTALRFSAYGREQESYQLTMYLASTPPKRVCNIIFPDYSIEERNEMPVDIPGLAIGDDRPVYLVMTEAQVKVLKAGGTLEFSVADACRQQ